MLAKQILKRKASKRSKIKQAMVYHWSLVCLLISDNRVYSSITQALLICNVSLQIVARIYPATTSLIDRLMIIDFTYLFTSLYIVFSLLLLLFTMYCVLLNGKQTVKDSLRKNNKFKLFNIYCVCLVANYCIVFPFSLVIYLRLLAWSVHSTLTTSEYYWMIGASLPFVICAFHFILFAHASLPNIRSKYILACSVRLPVLFLPLTLVATLLVDHYTRSSSVEVKYELNMLLFVNICYCVFLLLMIYFCHFITVFYNLRCKSQLVCTYLCIISSTTYAVLYHCIDTHHTTFGLLIYVILIMMFRIHFNNRLSLPNFYKKPRLTNCLELEMYFEEISRNSEPIETIYLYFEQSRDFIYEQNVSPHQLCYKHIFSQYSELCSRQKSNDLETMMHFASYLSHNRSNYLLLGSLLRKIHLNGTSLRQLVQIEVLENTISRHIKEKEGERESIDEAKKDGLGAIRVSVDIYKTVEAVNMYEKLIVEMGTQIELVMNFYRLLEHPRVNMTTIHSLVGSIKRQRELCEKLFQKVDEASGTHLTFHLLPYAMFIELTENNYERGKDIVRAYDHKVSLITKHSGFKSKEFTNQSTLMDKSITLVMHGEKPGLGNITFTSKNLHSVFGSEMVELEGRNIDIFFPPEMAKLHMTKMENFLNEFDKNYFRIPWMRYITYSNGIYYRVISVSKFVSTIHEGFSIVILIKNISSIYSGFTLAIDKDHNIIGASEDWVDARNNEGTMLLGIPLWDFSIEINNVLNSFKMDGVKSLKKAITGPNLNFRRFGSALDTYVRIAPAWAEGVTANGIYLQTFSNATVRIDCQYIKEGDQSEVLYIINVDTAIESSLDQEKRKTLQSSEFGGARVHDTIKLPSIREQNPSSIGSKYEEQDVPMSQEFPMPSSMIVEKGGIRDSSPLRYTIEFADAEQILSTRRSGTIKDSNKVARFKKIDPRQVDSFKDLSPKKFSVDTKKYSAETKTLRSMKITRPHTAPVLPKVLKEVSSARDVSMFKMKMRGSINDGKSDATTRSSASIRRRILIQLMNQRKTVTFIAFVLLICISYWVCTAVYIQTLSLFFKDNFEKINSVQQLFSEIVDLDNYLKSLFTSTVLYVLDPAVYPLFKADRYSSLNPNWTNITATSRALYDYDTTLVYEAYETLLKDIQKLLPIETQEFFSISKLTTIQVPITNDAYESESSQHMNDMNDENIVEMAKIIKGILDRWVSAPAVYSNWCANQYYRHSILDWLDLMKRSVILFNDENQIIINYMLTISAILMIFTTLGFSTLLLLLLYTGYSVRSKIVKLYLVLQYVKPFEVNYKRSKLDGLKNRLENSLGDSNAFALNYSMSWRTTNDYVRRKITDSSSSSRIRRVNIKPSEWFRFGGYLVTLAVLMVIQLGLNNIIMSQQRGSAGSYLSWLTINKEYFLTIFYQSSTEAVVYLQNLDRIGMFKLNSSYHGEIDGILKNYLDHKKTLLHQLRKVRFSANNLGYNKFFEDPCKQIDLVPYNLSLENCDRIGSGTVQASYLDFLEYQNIPYLGLQEMLNSTWANGSTILTSNEFKEIVFSNKIIHRPYFSLIKNDLRDSSDKVNADSVKFINALGIGLLVALASISFVILVLLILKVTKEVGVCISVFYLLPLETFSDNLMVKSQIKRIAD